MTIDPFQPDVVDGKLYGRGSCDTKAGLAAMMHAISDLKESGSVPPCDVWLVAVTDEEYGFTGVTRYSRDLDVTAAIIAEPTDLRLVVAAKGCVRWRIWTLGRAAHSSKPQLGINAIDHMARIIGAINASSTSLLERSHPLLGNPTCNIGVIHGGVQVNFVPDTCYIDVDRRLIAGEEPGAVVAEYESLLNELKNQLPDLQFRMDKPRIFLGALETPVNSRIVEQTARVLKDKGLDPTPIGVPFGCNGNLLSERGIPNIVLGPGSIDQAHSAVEFVECSQVQQAVEIYRDLISSFEP
jgi:acetylornithine deacetylase